MSSLIQLYMKEMKSPIPAFNSPSIKGQWRKILLFVTKKLRSGTVIKVIKGQEKEFPELFILTKSGKFPLTLLYISRINSDPGWFNKIVLNFIIGKYLKTCIAVLLCVGRSLM